MKKYRLHFICLGFSAWLFLQLSISAKAQNPDEWLRPKQTQIQYLLTQAISLRTLNKSLSDGYEIFRAGSGLIASMKNREFEAHHGYFDRFSGLFGHPESLTGVLSLQGSLDKLDHQLREIHSYAVRKQFPDYIQNAFLARITELHTEVSKLKADLLQNKNGFTDKEENRYQRNHQLSGQAALIKAKSSLLLLQIESYTLMRESSSFKGTD